MGTVQATVKTDHFYGPIAKSITVTTNDPKNPTIALSVKLNIVGSVQLVPAPIMSINYTSRQAQTVGRVTVRKDPTETGDLRITELKSSQPWIKVSSRVVSAAEPAIEGLAGTAAGDVVLEATLDPVPEQGARNESVTFNTGLPREPSVTVPISIFIPPSLNLNPRDLVLGAPVNSTSTGVIHVRARADLDPEKLTATVSPDAFEVHVNPGGPAGAMQVVVTWTQKGKETPTAGSVTLHLGSESATVPVRVTQSAVGTGNPAAADAGKPVSRP